MGKAILLQMILFLVGASKTVGSFYEDVDIIYGGSRAQILNNGQQMTLSLDRDSGSGFQTKRDYLLGRFDMQLKLVPGNSAGTVTTFYLSSQGPDHDEIDFEFLGNSTGQPYTLHTNVYSQGKGNREQQFRLWFDPTVTFHTYSIVWNRLRIIFLVDNIPIRVSNNLEAEGVPYPNRQPMRVYATIWNADDWATQGGRVKTDWSLSPFTASYRNFKANACFVSSGCPATGDRSWQEQTLDAAGRNRIRWVQRNFMIYNYCTDRYRFPQGLPFECSQSRFL